MARGVVCRLGDARMDKTSRAGPSDPGSPDPRDRKGLKKRKGPKATFLLAVLVVVVWGVIGIVRKRDFVSIDQVGQCARWPMPNSIRRLLHHDTFHYTQHVIPLRINTKLLID